MRAAFVRILTRTLITLFAAALVAGAFTLWVDSGMGQRLPIGSFAFAGGIRIDRFGGQPGSTRAFNPPSRFLAGPPNGISWWAGLTGILRNLGLVALVTIGVAVLSRLIRWITRPSPD